MLNEGYNNLQVKIIRGSSAYETEKEINEELNKITGSIIDVQVQFFSTSATTVPTYVGTIKYIPEQTTRMTLKESK